MKSKLQLSILVALLLLVSMGVTLAQKKPVPTPPGGPPPQQEAPANIPSPPAVDPATGLPVSQPQSWIDIGWDDQGIRLTNVSYDDIPLAEVAKDLRDKFKELFDVLLPRAVPRSGGVESADGIPIRLRLKNVTASEVFHAMNLLFESEGTPLRWELKMNGTRPMVLLRALPEPTPPTPAPPPEPRRMVYFVGDLTGGEKSGGMTVQQVLKTVSEICQMTYGHEIDLKFHEAAQLIIASGSPEQITFIEQTLSALRKKIMLDQRTAFKASRNTKKAEATKPGGAAAPK